MAIAVELLQAYLDEFTFRFNRRHSAARGMLFYRLLELAANAPQVTYADLAALHQPKKKYSAGYVGGPRASGPASLARPAEHRPWRQVPLIGTDAGTASSDVAVDG